MKPLRILNHLFESRLFVGTGKFASNELMAQAIEASGSQLVTVAMKRIDLTGGTTSRHSADHLIEAIPTDHVHLLPNTSGARTAKEAIFVAHLAREALGTDLIKVEVHPDPKYLMPDPIETLRTVEQLAADGFTVMPYVQADPVLCKHLEEAGAACVMPLGSPIGSNKGLVTEELLRIIIEQASVPVVVDAGIGAPSHAAHAMELGADAVLVNTAIATAGDPVAMAQAFAEAVAAGRRAYEAGLPGVRSGASASSPLMGFFD